MWKSKQKIKKKSRGRGNVIKRRKRDSMTRKVREVGKKEKENRKTVKVMESNKEYWKSEETTDMQMNGARR